MEIQVTRGDITQADVEAIVNAANPGLHRGAGVCGAIFMAAGNDLDAYINENEWHGCPTGGAVITPSFNLEPSGIKHIIHTVGPDMRVVDNLNLGAELLLMAYRESIALAIENGITSIAFPAISTGVYGFPPEIAAKIAMASAVPLHDIESPLEKVVFVAFDEKTEELLDGALTALMDHRARGTDV